MPFDNYSGWICCCPEGCWEYRDCWTDPHNLCLPNSSCRTKLGPHWRIKYPIPPPTTWWIGLVLRGYDEYCVLVEEGNPGAFLLCVDAIPKGPDNHEDPGAYSHFMAATVIIGAYGGMQVGDSYGLILDYVENETEGVCYFEIRATQTDATHALIEVFKITGETEVLLDDCEFLNSIHEDVIGFTINGCISHGYLYATVSGLSSETLAIKDPSIPAESVVNPGWRAGFKHYINGRYVLTDAWLLTEVWDDDSVNCQSCGICACDNSDSETEDYKEPISRNLTAVLVADPDGECSALDGLTADLNAGSCGTSGTSWTGYIENGCLAPFDDGGSHYQLDLQLDCPPAGMENALTEFKLWVNVSTYPCACTGPTGLEVLELHPNEEESTCDPFTLVFDVSYTVDNTFGGAAIGSGCQDGCTPCGGHPSGFPPYDCSTVYPGEIKTVSYKIVITE